jgi:8-oxo-dGTP pyrophosphatase MutT (NUDIX family)
VTSPFVVDEVDTVECLLEPEPWRFAIEQSAAIDAHWTQQRAKLPHLFNGRVLLQHRSIIERNASGRKVLRGAYFEAEFKAFLAWRDFDFPQPGVRNAFAMAALRGGDGGFVLGEMGAHTANAGKIYFPSGTPDLSDLVGDRVDLEGSARRELLEETGLDPDELSFEPGFTLIHDARMMGCMKLVRSSEPAEVLVERIHAALARETTPELVHMHIVRRETEISPQIPGFVAHYLRRAFAAD